jgi:glycosyltransferase involved in cell wall biosynthesis
LKQRVCFVSQRYYPGDARMYTQIKGLQEAGYEVDVLCMKGRRQPSFSVEDGVSIYRLPSMVRQRNGKLRYLAEYASFWIPAFLLLTGLHLKKRYQAVDVTNLPDVLLYSAIIPKLLGAKIIYDVRECSPEIFADRFAKDMDSGFIRMITRIEQRCLRFADMAVTCTEQMRQAMVKRGGNPDKISVILNVGMFPENAALTAPDPDTSQEFRIATHGTIIKRYGHEVLIRAMAHVVRQVPQAHLEIMGRGNLEAELQQQVEQLGLQKHVTFAGFVPDDELLKRLSRAHCGVVPLLRNPESDIIHTYKMFEYISLGIPTVISRTSAAEAYFDEASLYFVEAGSPEALANALIDLANDPDKRRSLARNARQTFEQYAPARQRAAFARIVSGLLHRPDSAAYDALGLSSEN